MNDSVTILVVDDNPATLYTTTRVLRSAGFQVREACNGGEALQLALTGVDLLVLDVNLPDLSGFEVCKQLRDDERTRHLPVIHLSATFVKDVDKVQGLDVGADGYLTHPVEPPVLIATVQAFLRTRQAEERTRQSEAKYRAIFDRAPSGIALLDQQLFCIEANAALPALLGRDASTLVGTDLRPLLAEVAGGGPDVRTELERHGSWSGAAPLPRGDKTVHLDWQLSQHALPGVWLLLVNDVSALVQLETERTQLLASERAARADAERANRSKDDFLATISHDLRGPIGAIVNWSRVLQQPNVAPADRLEGARAIERNAALQVQLIADLLDVSRIASGKLRLTLGPVDAERVVDGALDVVRANAEAKNVTLGKTLHATARWLSADATRLQQVMWNLLSNAIKFTPAGGRVEVTLRDARPERGGLEIVVRDTGEGIERDLLPHLFDRFRQGHRASPRQEGLGLGLSIVRHLVEAHAGSVYVHSDGLGKGAEFVVHLPTATTRELDVGAAACPELDGQALAGMRVLVVDDDPDTRLHLQRVLEEHAAVVRSANGHAAAIALARTFHPDALVSDIGMPGRDGYELIRDLRGSGWTAERLPAITVTAFTSDADRERALAAGFQRHLPKPVTPHDLIAALVAFRRERGADYFAPQ
jgi:signal transduction histidine kinase